MQDQDQDYYRFRFDLVPTYRCGGVSADSEISSVTRIIPAISGEGSVT